MLRFMRKSRFSDEQLGTFLLGCRDSTEREYWEPHPDLPLMVSNLGGLRRLNGRSLHPYPSKGYPTVDIRGRHRRVHHLVLETFIGPRPPGLQCCHWDGVKTNNRLMNLRWDTPGANGQDAMRHHRERARRAFNHRQDLALQRIREGVTRS
jgi:hypothetical protein